MLEIAAELNRLQVLVFVLCMIYLFYMYIYIYKDIDMYVNVCNHTPQLAPAVAVAGLF